MSGCETAPTEVVVDDVRYRLLGEMPLRSEAAGELGPRVDQEFWTHPLVPRERLMLAPGSDPEHWYFYVSPFGELPVAACSLLPIDFEPPRECAPQWG